MQNKASCLSKWPYGEGRAYPPHIRRRRLLYNKTYRILNITMINNNTIYGAAADYIPESFDPESQNVICMIIHLKSQVNGNTLRSVVEDLRIRFPYFYIKAVRKNGRIITEPNALPMIVRNTWEPIGLNSKDSNYHIAAWKYEGNKLAFEVPHSLTDGAGVMPYIESAIYLYLSKETGIAFNPDGFHLPGSSIPKSETEDPFADIGVSNAANCESSNPNSDFFRLDEETETDERKTAFYLKLPESQVMEYCKKHNGSPNVFVSVMLARAARRLAPDSKKNISVLVAVDYKAVFKIHDNYRAYAGNLTLDFPASKNLNDTTDIFTTARNRLKQQAEPENILRELKKMKSTPMLTDTPIASFTVSYPNTKGFKELSNHIEELQLITSLSKITDILCEITCINNCFFLAFLQSFSSRRFLDCFLKELKSANINYEFLRKEPIKLCEIKSL